MDVFDVSISIPELKELKPINAKKMSIKTDGVVYLVE